MPRPPATGRFKTREELVEKVLFLNGQGALKASEIARNCGVSAPTVSRIIAEGAKPPANNRRVQTKCERVGERKALPPLNGKGITHAEHKKPSSIEGLYCLCFQKNLGPEAPFEAKILRNHGSRLELKVGRKTVTAHRGACSSYPYREKQR